MSKRNPNAPLSIQLLAFLATGLFVSGCEVSNQAKSDIEYALTDPTPAPTSTPDSTPAPSESPAPMDSPSPSASPSCDASPLPSASPVASCYTDEFQQPAAQILHSVDILFIADTSGSMSNKRLKVANALSAFVGALPAGTDYRIGVVLAHGSNDPNVGKLYTSSGSIPKVLNSTLLSQVTIQNHLKTVMLAAPDYSGVEGEMGSFALLKALSAARLAESRALGFFRQDAALAVVTISDENDACATYPEVLPATYQPKTTPTIAGMPGMTTSELSIRKKDCPNGISSSQVIDTIKSVQGDRPYVIGAVIHTNKTYIASTLSDSYGWGYGKTVEDSYGVLVDISSADYSIGLAKLGSLTSVKIQLLSDFTLSHSDVAANSIQVLVDRNPASFDYIAAQNQVHLFQLGTARSEIEVQYCTNIPIPSPSPVPSPSPSATPAPSASPSASPAPSATPAPTATPEPSPEPSPSPSPEPEVDGGVIGV